MNALLLCVIDFGNFSLKIFYYFSLFSRDVTAKQTDVSMGSETSSYFSQVHYSIQIN